MTMIVSAMSRRAVIVGVIIRVIRVTRVRIIVAIGVVAVAIVRMIVIMIVVMAIIVVVIITWIGAATAIVVISRISTWISAIIVTTGLTRAQTVVLDGYVMKVAFATVHRQPVIRQVAIAFSKVLHGRIGARSERQEQSAKGRCE